MRTAIIASVLAAATFGSGAASAAPTKHYDLRRYDRGVSPYDHILIAQSAARLAFMKRHAWADGKISFFERRQIRQAEQRHYALLQRARRS